ncbi:MAG: hypothetical protein JWR09_3085 [Mucilaginibacter sp.]|nr:hypothetical protein [Mucilaginibacter sp.]
MLNLFQHLTRKVTCAKAALFAASFYDGVPKEVRHDVGVYVLYKKE